MALVSAAKRVLRFGPVRLCTGLLVRVAEAILNRGKCNSPFLNHNFAPVEANRFVAHQDLRVRGRIPDDVRGAFLRIGPNPALQPQAGYHWFDGDGMVHALSIRSRGDDPTQYSLSYHNQYVETDRLKMERDAKRELFLKLGGMAGRVGFLRVMLSMLKTAAGLMPCVKGNVDSAKELDEKEVKQEGQGFNGFSVANTAMMYHNRQILALNEADAPYVISVNEEGRIQTQGRIDFQGKLTHPFTAHPKIDPETKEVMHFGYHFQNAPYLNYGVLSPDHRVLVSTPIPVSEPTMVHDFAITRDYSVFLVHPVVFRPESMIKDNRMPVIFDRTKPTRIAVVPRHGSGQQAKWFETSACAVFHTINAWQEINQAGEEEVVLVACRLAHVNLELENLREPNSKTSIHEWRMNTSTGRCTEKDLVSPEEGDGDFPVMNPQFTGRKSRYAWVAQPWQPPQNASEYLVKMQNFLFQGCVKIDMVENRVCGVIGYGDQKFGGECFFVPRAQAESEDDGYLMTFVFDEAKQRSELWIMDARTMHAEPIAVVELPVRIPYGFHALFVQESELQAQRRNH
eukprot:TRINITY_DN3686_c0_g1_i4.p1 TRINITY_DN3686_c0_g1~~TRINITY_DN3686_c0_g1_i4.p1  ORF type:complete len:591 (-),score=130.03 TRINITY_DN3686_c0_g1_i4:22-1728(-)